MPKHNTGVKDGWIKVKVKRIEERRKTNRNTGPPVFYLALHRLCHTNKAKRAAKAACSSLLYRRVAQETMPTNTSACLCTVLLCFVYLFPIRA